MRCIHGIELAIRCDQCEAMGGDGGWDGEGWRLVAPPELLAVLAARTQDIADTEKRWGDTLAEVERLRIELAAEKTMREQEAAKAQENAVSDMSEPRLENVKTWRDLCTALRNAGYEQAATWVESWQDEYLPGREDEELPGERA